MCCNDDRPLNDFRLIFGRFSADVRLTFVRFDGQDAGLVIPPLVLLQRSDALGHRSFEPLG